MASPNRTHRRREPSSPARAGFEPIERVFEFEEEPYARNRRLCLDQILIENLLRRLTEAVMRHLRLFILLPLALAQFIKAQDCDGRKTTVKFLQELQRPDGSFLAMPRAIGREAPPSLRATSSAIRALHYFGGS